MGPHSGTHVKRLPAQWWKAAGWVQSLGEHQPSLQTLHCTPHQHGHGSWHWNTFPVPGALSTHPHQVSSVPTKWPSWALGQMLSQGLQKPCKVSCWQLDTFLAAAWRQRLHLLCLYLGHSTILCGTILKSRHQLQRRWLSKIFFLCFSSGSGLERFSVK